MKRKLIALTIGTAAVFAAGNANAEAQAPTWFHYRGAEPQAPRLVVKAKCLNYEDSAAHLRLLEFGDGRAVYGCFKAGY